ncbi:MAG: type II CAAX endopeptidase family protein [Gemmatimonadota bacterium]
MPFGGWAWAVTRLVAFIGLVSLFAIVLGIVWTMLPLPTTTTVAFLGAAVTAASAVLAGAVLLRFADHRSPAALGISFSRLTLPHVGIGLAIGFTALIAAVLALLLTGTLRYDAQAGTMAAWLSVIALQGGIFVVAAFAEEALFRGYPFQVLARWAGPAAAVLVTSLLFAAAHGANPEIGPIALVNIFLAGAMLGVAYLRTLSLWFATAVHVGWNWAMATWFDLPVSGIAGFDTPLYQPAIDGPVWWSGGAFGPEGGLVGTLGFSVAFAALYLRLVRPDPAIRRAGPLFVEHEKEQA